MSMKHYLGLRYDELKQRFKRDGSEPKTRVDSDLPLSLRHGSRIQFSEAPFLLTGDSCQVKYPGSEVLVHAFSSLTLAGLKSNRFYIESREDPDESAMLMVLLDDDGTTVNEMYLFHEQYEIPLYHVKVEDVSEHEDETNAVNFWIGKDEGILGMTLFHTPDELTYERLWEHDNDRWLEPAQVQETIHLDPYGDSSTVVEHLGTMLYARTFEGLGTSVDEYLLATVERDDNGFRVRIWVGIPISMADIELPDAA